MKQIRWFKFAALSAAIFMGLALNSCTDETDDMSFNDFSETQAALSTATVTKGAISVRTGPGTWYDRIGGLRYGKTVEIIQEQAGWLNIKYGDTDGWIYRPHTDMPASSSAASCSPELADFIRDNYPDGYNIVLAYNGSDQAGEFHSQANSFSKEYHTLNVASGALGKDIYRKVKTYDQFKTGILETGLAVVQCLEDNPREGYDDSKCSQIKNLTVMTHGFSNGLNFGSNSFKSANISEFGSTVYGYLNNSALRVQLYACSTALAPNNDEDWFERRGGYGKPIPEIDPFNKGKGSFAQLLSEEMGPDATVFGHTTAGHLSGNYAARCYGKMADGAVHGKHMFDIYFPQSFVAEQAKRTGKSEIDTRTSMYSTYMNNFKGNNSGRDTFMDPEGKGQKMRDIWLSNN